MNGISCHHYHHHRHYSIPVPLVGRAVAFYRYSWTESKFLQDLRTTKIRRVSTMSLCSMFFAICLLHTAHNTDDDEPVKVVWNKPSPEQQHVKNPFTVFTSTCTELSKQSTQSLSTKIVSPGCSFYSRINQNKRKR